MYFLKRLQVMYNSAKFHYRICVTDFREWPVYLDYFFRVIMILTSVTNSNYISWRKSFLLFQKLTEDFSVQLKLKTFQCEILRILFPHLMSIFAKFQICSNSPLKVVHKMPKIINKSCYEELAQDHCYRW